MPTVACLGWLREVEGEVDAAVGGSTVFSGFTDLLAADLDVSAVKKSGVSASTSFASLAAFDFGVNGLPHWGQKLARTRMDTPQERQRRAISGSGISRIVNGKW